MAALFPEDLEFQPAVLETNDPPAHSFPAKETAVPPEETPSTPKTPTPSLDLQHKNPKRRLRIPTEDHRLFLDDLREELPFIDVCREINNSSDANIFPMSSHNHKQSRPFASSHSTSTKRRFPEGNINTIQAQTYGNGAAAASTSSRYVHWANSSKFQQNNNSVMCVSLDDNSEPSTPEPTRRKAYNSPKKSGNANNCIVV